MTDDRYIWRRELLEHQLPRRATILTTTAQRWRVRPQSTSRVEGQLSLAIGAAITTSPAYATSSGDPTRGFPRTRSSGCDTPAAAPVVPAHLPGNGQRPWATAHGGVHDTGCPRSSGPPPVAIWSATWSRRAIMSSSGPETRPDPTTVPGTLHALYESMRLPLDLSAVARPRDGAKTQALAEEPAVRDVGAESQLAAPDAATVHLSCELSASCSAAVRSNPAECQPRRSRPVSGLSRAGTWRRSVALPCHMIPDRGPPSGPARGTDPVGRGANGVLARRVVSAERGRGPFVLG
jgi:hypothetical protein